MTVVWSWVDLGDHTLQRYNIKQYWLLMSVLSVQKFNPEWKRVFVVDKQTSDFLNKKGWSDLWDDIKVVDFHETEYGDLYNIQLYSWPKIYSYGLIDDDVLILDIDIVFLRNFTIPDTSKVIGRLYNHHHSFVTKTSKANLSYKWNDINDTQTILYENEIIEDLMEPDTICYQGAPIFCPKEYTKLLQSYLIEHIRDVESFFNGLSSNETYQAIEEEFPLSQFARKYTGICGFNNRDFRHGYIYNANTNIDCGFHSAETIIGIPIFEKYLNKYEQSNT